MKAKTKDSKDVVLAKISIKQAIAVAIISLVSAVAATTIPHLDRFKTSSNFDAEEVGYYQGRATIVTRAFHDTEEAIQAQSELAQQQGKLVMANQLKDLRNEVQRRAEKFQELHSWHVEAIHNGKRLQASIVRTQANENIRELDRLLEDFPTLAADLDAHEEGHRLAQIPLYGKGGIMLSHEQVCTITGDQELIVSNESE